MQISSVFLLTTLVVLGSTSPIHRRTPTETIIFHGAAGAQYSLAVPLDGIPVLTNNPLSISTISSSTVNVATQCTLKTVDYPPALVEGPAGTWAVGPPQTVCSIACSCIPPTPTTTPCPTPPKPTTTPCTTPIPTTTPCPTPPKPTTTPCTTPIPTTTPCPTPPKPTTTPCTSPIPTTTPCPTPPKPTTTPCPTPPIPCPTPCPKPCPKHCQNPDPTNINIEFDGADPTLGAKYTLSIPLDGSTVLTNNALSISTLVSTYATLPTNCHFDYVDYQATLVLIGPNTWAVGPPQTIKSVSCQA